MVVELYERSVVTEPIVEIVILTVHVHNIWADLEEAPVKDIE